MTFNNYSQRGIIVVVYTTREYSKNKQDNTFWRDILVFISEQSETFFCDEYNIPSLRSPSWDIAQYPEIANQ